MTSVLPTRILMLLGSEEQDAQSSDVRLPRAVAASFFFFRDRGVEIVFASEAGGFPPVAGEMRLHSGDAAVAKFLADPHARDEIADALALEQVVVDDFDVVVVFVSNAVSVEADAVIAQFLAQGKIAVLSAGTSLAGSLPSGNVVFRNQDGGLEWAETVMRSLGRTSG